MSSTDRSSQGRSRGLNEVRLVGRVAGRHAVELPSGDELWTFRVVVPERPDAGAGDASEGGLGAVLRLDGAGAAQRRQLASRRHRRGERARAPPVLPLPGA